MSTLKRKELGSVERICWLVVDHILRELCHRGLLSLTEDLRTDVATDDRSVRYRRHLSWISRRPTLQVHDCDWHHVLSCIMANNASLWSLA